jgi:hypothetical protein
MIVPSPALVENMDLIVHNPVNVQMENNVVPLMVCAVVEVDGWVQDARNLAQKAILVI